jgi:uncharacterized protein
MARPKRIRKVTNPPHFRGFRPIGLPDAAPVLLNYEEYEAVRLSDFELLGQVDAAHAMSVSRPTFARIYESARRKIALALVKGLPILFEGGKVYFDSEWYACNKCGCWFNHPAKDQAVEACALCGSDDIEQYHENNSSDESTDMCICPKCGKKQPHEKGKPCRKSMCPDCNCEMTRSGNPHGLGKGRCNK